MRDEEDLAGRLLITSCVIIAVACISVGALLSFLARAFS